MASARAAASKRPMTEHAAWTCLRLARVRAAGLYQFKHLSFQEALSGEYVLHLAKLVEANASVTPPKMWATDDAAIAFLRQPVNQNMILIGGRTMGAALAKLRPRWDFSSCPHMPRALFLLLRDNANLHELRLGALTDGISSKACADQLADILPGCKSLATVALVNDARPFLDAAELLDTVLAKANSKALTSLDLSSRALPSTVQ